MADRVGELRRELHRRGYDTKKDGHHIKIFKDGDPVRTRKGMPLEIVITGDDRSFNNTLSNLRDAGVLPPRIDEEAMKRARGKKKVPRSMLVTQSNDLREELQLVMEEYSLTQADVVHYADYYAGQHNIHIPSYGQGAISKFLKGTYLTAPNYMWLSTALEAIQALDGKIPKGEELKEKMPQKEEPKGIEVEGTSSHAITRTPDLAFETMQAIYREEKDDDAILDLVQRIAKLELS